jgi:hypothetical protein
VSLSIHLAWKQVTIHLNKCDMLPRGQLVTKWIPGLKHSLTRSSGRNCVPKRLRFHPHARVAHCQTPNYTKKLSLTTGLFSYKRCRAMLPCGQPLVGQPRTKWIPGPKRSLTRSSGRNGVPKRLRLHPSTIAPALFYLPPSLAVACESRQVFAPAKPALPTSM